MASVLTSLDFVMDIRIVVIDQMKKTDHVENVTVARSSRVCLTTSVLITHWFAMVLPTVLISLMRWTVLVHQHVSLPAQMDNVLTFEGSVTQ